MPSFDSDARQRVNEAIFWAAVADAVSVVCDAAREEAQGAMITGDHEKITATTDDGVSLGTFSRTLETQVWDLTDPDAYREWVIAKRPDQTVAVVNSMFTKWVLAQAAANDGIVADPETGEMIPGIGRRPKPGRFTMRRTDEARARARDVLRAIVAGVPGVALPPSVRNVLEQD